MKLPSYLQIEPAGYCNLRCRMCASRLRRDRPSAGLPALMGFDSFASIIDQAGRELKELHLQGLGEPMLHPRFWGMVRYAADRGVRVTTNSNLTLLSDRGAEECIRSGLESISISIDGATSETYRYVRTGSSLERVLRNLELLTDIRAQLSARHPRIRLVAVVMRRNLHELAGLVRLAGEWRMDGVFVQHLCHDFGEVSLPSAYREMREFIQAESLVHEDRARVEDCFASARLAVLDTGVELRLPRTDPRPYPRGVRGSERCDWPWRGMYISYQGSAMPCCMVGTPDRVNFGNVLTSGLETTWNNDAYRDFRGRLDSDDPPEICLSCSVYRHTF